ncbi:MAG: zf-HC2 domain-containing protein [Clostridia bacterium]|nr:zf-HC2 domain-containing protein [Clostridia bacterium]
MKECIDFESLIPEYLDGELDTSLCREFEAHIEECPSCKKTLDEMRSLLADISQSAPPVPAELKEGVMSRIAAENSIRRKKHLVTLFGSAAACFVIAVGVMSAIPYLSGNIGGLDKSESFSSTEDAGPGLEYSNTADNYKDAADQDAVEEPSEVAPENWLSQSGNSSVEEENVTFEAEDDAVGALREDPLYESIADGALPDSSVSDLAASADDSLNPGSITSQKGDSAESANEDGGESGDGSDFEKYDGSTDPEEDEGLDYGALFMTRGAAELTEILKNEE